MLDMDDNSNTNAQMFGGTYATYEVYFKEILAQCTTTLKKHGITGEMGKPIRQWYIPQTLIETRTEHDINQELELVSALKIMADKKLDPEIERFIKRERTIAADSAVLNYHRLVVTGKSYTGKTTWLHHLAITYCTGNISNQERGIVPILLSGQRLTEASSTSLWEVLQQWIAPYFSRTPGESLPLETILESGPCLLLLDDFEQLGTITQQEQVAKQILALAQRFPQLGILVTAYSDHCLKCLPGFHKLELRGFNDKQMRKFLRYHFAGAGTAIGIALAKVIEKNHHVHQVARNPQLLEILALVFAREGKLPTRRTELYQRLSAVFGTYWKNRYSEEEIKAKEEILMELAYESYCLESKQVSAEIMAQVLAHYGGVWELEKASYLGYFLREVVAGQYEFFFTGWQAYFTALALIHKKVAIKKILAYMDDPWWEEVILFYAGMMADVTPLVRHILNHVTEDNYYLSYILAGKCMGEAKAVEAELVPMVAAELWSMYQDDVLIESIGSPMEVLAALKPEYLINQLIAQLASKKAAVRSHTAFVLETLGDHTAVPALINILHKDKDGYTRGVAASALGSLGCAEHVVPELVTALKQDKTSYVQAGAIEAFRELGSSEAVAILLEVLKNNPNDYVRSGAADALGTMGIVEVIPVLSSTLASDPSIDVRISAADALGMLDDLSALPALTHALQHDEEWQVRVCAIEALESLGSVAAIPALTHALKHDPEWKVRVNLVATLCVLGCVSALPALIEALQNDDHGFVRYRAAKALGKVGNESTLAVLKKALSIKGTGVDKFIKKVAQQSIERIQLRLGKTESFH